MLVILPLALSSIRISILVSDYFQLFSDFFNPEECRTKFFVIFEMFDARDFFLSVDPHPCFSFCFCTTVPLNKYFNSDFLFRF